MGETKRKGLIMANWWKGSYGKDKAAKVTALFLTVFLVVMVAAGLPWYWGVLGLIGYVLLFYFMRKNQ